MPRRYVQLDVFAARPGDGNPLAVVLEAEGLDDATMQAIARWTRLPETTFVFPPTTPEATHAPPHLQPAPRGAVRRPSQRRHRACAAGCGAGDAARRTARAGRHRRQRCRCACAAKARARTVAVRTPRARVQEIAAPDDARLRAALAGLQLGALPPVLMDGGRRWWLVELASEAHLRSVEPNWDAIARAGRSQRQHGPVRLSRAATDPVYYYAVRAFVGAPARFEDAASGAANATLAAWLAERDALPGGDGFYRRQPGPRSGP